MNDLQAIQPTADHNADNGVNVAALLEARTALTEMPEAAQFEWRAESEWKNGTHTRSTINRFFGLGEVQDRGKQFDIDTDHPEVFAAEDHGATPVEMMLVGLAGCLTGGIASVAQHRDIQLHSVRATLRAPMDLAGIMGIDPEVRNGFSSLKVTFHIEADATDDEIAALVAQSQKRSAVYDIITNPTDVLVDVNP